LLSLYYFKKTLHLQSATGFQLARELRENGMPPANISVAMQANVRLQRAESRVIRGEKGTRQSRNEYVITEAGIQYVESRFNLDYDHGRTRSGESPDQMIGIGPPELGASASE
jgi:DNA-binding PadR family transcriptional regulator